MCLRHACKRSDLSADMFETENNQQIFIIAEKSTSYFKITDFVFKNHYFNYKAFCK